jgi:hypothetical protein
MPSSPVTQSHSTTGLLLAFGGALSIALGTFLFADESHIVGWSFIVYSAMGFISLVAAVFLGTRIFDR